MKSCSLHATLNYLISGSADITFGIPPKCLNFASISPNVLDTESLPGNTQCGPIYYYICGRFLFRMLPLLSNGIFIGNCV